MKLERDRKLTYRLCHDCGALSSSEKQAKPLKGFKPKNNVISFAF